MAKRNSKNNVRSVLLILLVLFIGGATYLAWQFWHGGDGAEEGTEEVIVTIPDGSGFSAILDTLEGAGLISDKTSFRILVMATGADDELKSGTYKFNRGVSQAALLEALREGRSTVRVKVTFPEGVTIRRIASIAQEKAGIDSAELVRLANDRTFLEKIGLTASTAEGYLMPDTYFVYWGEPPGQLLERMAGLFLEFYDAKRKEKAKDVGLTPYEAVILASLVEGEARVGSERARIAGLYLNRLKKGMLLQADPTIQYILPDGPRRLLYKDLEINSPYNTYRVAGLPPTPINSPSRASVDAVLNPEKHGFIYFVAKGDGSGEHTFSRTAGEHERAVREYRQRRRDG